MTRQETVTLNVQKDNNNLNAKGRIIRLLVDSLEDSLSILGSQNRQLLVNALAESGLTLDSEHFDLIRFTNHLRLYFPQFADSILQHTYSVLCQKLSLPQSRLEHEMALHDPLHSILNIIVHVK